MVIGIKDVLLLHKVQTERQLREEGFLRPKPKRRWTMDELMHIMAGRNPDGTEKEKPDGG